MGSPLPNKWLRWTIEVLLLGTSICVLRDSGGCMVLAAPKAKVSCTATNHPEVIAHKREDGGGYLEEVDDWYVHCALSAEGKTIWENDLPLAHPTGYEEAMHAINEFRTKQANQILKEKKK